MIILDTGPFYALADRSDAHHYREQNASDIAKPAITATRTLLHRDVENHSDAMTSVG